MKCTTILLQIDITLKGSIKMKPLLLFLLFFLNLYGSEVFVYEVSKNDKKLGEYRVVFDTKTIKTKKSKATNKIPFFIDKVIVFDTKGHKYIEFSKNKKTNRFDIYTNKSDIPKDVRKDFNRLIKKAHKEILLIIKNHKTDRVELFNKRGSVVKTLDELLYDTAHNEVTYDKFILFDKNGVMKMVATIAKTPNGYIVTNKRTKKPYLKIEANDGVAKTVSSLMANWNAKLIKKGKEVASKISFEEGLKTYLQSKLQKEVTLNKLKKFKIKKSSIDIDVTYSFKLDDGLKGKKSYEKSSFCKKSVKKAKLKYKKISTKNDACNIEMKKRFPKKHFINELKSAFGDDGLRLDENGISVKKTIFEDVR